ncbi:hypothetical protein CF336_g4048 [Tilletia laevis]|nr:hypothetical protein CF336_g4048 [Tilletia laevis]KAE8202710.1 hypothetical protein CF335_g3308 [Tilletia laevis]
MVVLIVALPSLRMLGRSEVNGAARDVQVAVRSILALLSSSSPALAGATTIVGTSLCQHRIASHRVRSCSTRPPQPGEEQHARTAVHIAQTGVQFEKVPTALSRAHFIVAQVLVTTTITITHTSASDTLPTRTTSESQRRAALESSHPLHRLYTFSTAQPLVGAEIATH